MLLSFPVGVFVLPRVAAHPPSLFASVTVLLLLPLVALFEPARPWLPSGLVTAVLPLVDGAPPREFLRASVVTVLAIPALLARAVRRVGRREL